MILPYKIVPKPKAVKSIFHTINSSFYIFVYIYIYRYIFFFFIALYEPQFTWFYNRISCTITQFTSALISQATVRATLTQLVQILDTIRSIQQIVTCRQGCSLDIYLRLTEIDSHAEVFYLKQYKRQPGYPDIK